MRSGWKTSKSVNFSPVDANMIGLPVMVATESAAPPRASPSSFVKTTASIPMSRAKVSAVLTAS